MKRSDMLFSSLTGPSVVEAEGRQGSVDGGRRSGSTGLLPPPPGGEGKQTVPLLQRPARHRFRPLTCNFLSPHVSKPTARTPKNRVAESGRRFRVLPGPGRCTCRRVHTALTSARVRGGAQEAADCAVFQPALTPGSTGLAPGSCADRRVERAGIGGQSPRITMPGMATTSPHRALPNCYRS